jgi:hypothetical protein
MSKNYNDLSCKIVSGVSGCLGRGSEQDVGELDWTGNRERLSTKQMFVHNVFTLRSCVRNLKQRILSQ